MIDARVCDNSHILSATEGVSFASDPANIERHLDRYLSVYQHHYELFIRGMFFYFAAIGAVASYVFRPEASTEQQRYFMLVVIFTSSMTIIGCVVSLCWWSAINRRVAQMCEQLSIPSVPLFAPKYIVSLVMFSSVAVICAACVFLAKR